VLDWTITVQFFMFIYSRKLIRNCYPAKTVVKTVTLEKWATAQTGALSGSEGEKKSAKRGRSLMFNVTEISRQFETRGSSPATI